VVNHGLKTHFDEPAIYLFDHVTSKQFLTDGKNS
jgi:hypothetical protein